MTTGYNVIGLVSGGKDSLFSLLHCLANGHRIVALANLYPSKNSSSDDKDESQIGQQPDVTGTGDLDSFMYQTVGHTVIPLFEEALGIPLYRQEIVGFAVSGSKHYQPPLAEDFVSPLQRDETESMVPLLERIMKNHPEANAVSSGAILSDYQRTRVESIARRLGLTPLSYLWQYPSLPPGESTSLLDDMMAVGQDSRIIKCASGGLDSSILWENVSSARGKQRVTKAMARFGGLEAGAPLGEGGEFETLAIDGPVELWKKRIEVAEADRILVHAGAGTSLLYIKKAQVVSRGEEDAQLKTMKCLRIPELLDLLFCNLLHFLRRNLLSVSAVLEQEPRRDLYRHDTVPSWSSFRSATNLFIWDMTAAEAGDSAEAQMSALARRLENLLRDENVDADSIVFTTTFLRSMKSFEVVNNEYATLFRAPNPPARATVALGDAMPASVEVMMSVIIWFGPRQSLDGLHVQSLSYWAPANIGPYSQAITVPAALKFTETCSQERIVYIAGQVPLVPASMVVHQGEEESTQSNSLLDFCRQATLSLQHLWRIGTAMKVEWWANGIAFVVGDRDIPAKARIALAAWQYVHSLEAHTSIEAIDEEKEIDLWEQRYGSEQKRGGDLHQSYKLPSFVAVQSQLSSGYYPSFLVVQVSELPRECGIEWLATGIANARVHISTEDDDETTFAHCVLGATGTKLSQVTISADFSDEELMGQFKRIVHRAGPEVVMTVYTDRNPSIFGSFNGNLVCCQTVWGPNMQRLGAGIVLRADGGISRTGT